MPRHVEPVAGRPPAFQTRDAARPRKERFPSLSADERGHFAVRLHVRVILEPHPRRLERRQARLPVGPGAPARRSPLLCVPSLRAPVLVWLGSIVRRARRASGKPARGGSKTQRLALPPAPKKQPPSRGTGFAPSRL